MAKIMSMSSLFASIWAFSKSAFFKFLCDTFGPPTCDCESCNAIHISYESYHEVFIERSHEYLPEVKWSLMEWKHGRAKNVRIISIYSYRSNEHF